MAIRVSDCVQKSDERRLVLEGTRKGRCAGRNCGGQYGVEPPYDLVVYLRESSESSVDSGWPSKNFLKNGKESY